MLRVVQCLFLQFVLSGDVGRKQNEEKGEEEEAQRRKENTLTSGALEFLRISWNVLEFLFCLIGVPTISLDFLEFLWDVLVFSELLRISMLDKISEPCKNIVFIGFLLVFMMCLLRRKFCNHAQVYLCKSV